MKGKPYARYLTSFIALIDQLIWPLSLGSFPFSKPHLILCVLVDGNDFLVGGKRIWVTALLY